MKSITDFYQAKPSQKRSAEVVSPRAGSEEKVRLEKFGAFSMKVETEAASEFLASRGAYSKNQRPIFQKHTHLCVSLVTLRFVCRSTKQRQIP